MYQHLYQHCARLSRFNKYCVLSQQTRNTRSLQAQRQALNRFWIAAMLLTDPVLDVVRCELRRISPDVRNVRLVKQHVPKIL